MKRTPLKIFFCYAHADSELRQALDTHLDLLEREGIVAPWYDGRIAPGTEWSEAIQQNLRGADLVVFLISNAFLRSTYIAEVEVRLALELHRAGKARLVPVLVEEIENFAKLPFSKLEALPTKARPISQWNDRVRALDDVVAGIRRAALSLIIESGGAFEFGSHDFTEAELVALEPPERERALAGLKRLHRQLVDAVPARRLERNLVVASWSLNQFGRHELLPESLFYLAKIISAFDVVSLQEIHLQLDALRRLIAILGPEWGYLISDITEGAMGNLERFATLYYQRRVAFEHISGEVVLPERMLIDGKQFARKPLLASFRSGDFRFRVCAAHVHFGGGTKDARAHSLQECSTLAQFLARVAKRDRENIVLAGNFNIEAKNSAAVRAFKEQGFSIPPRTLHPSHLLSGKYYGLLGFLLNAEAEGARGSIRRSGVVNPFESVFRPEDYRSFSKLVRRTLGRKTIGATKSVSEQHYGRMWRTRQLSDHLPVWVELAIQRPRKVS
jgi:endonuclease/exonuclease/phosphatase family metal-dependent hydrolase